jgi:hypothetical protein
MDIFRYLRFTGIDENVKGRKRPNDPLSWDCTWKRTKEFWLSPGKDLCEAPQKVVNSECAKAAKSEKYRKLCELSDAEKTAAESELKECVDAAEATCRKNKFSRFHSDEPRTSTSAFSPNDETLASDSTSSKTKLQSPEENLPVPAQSIGLPIGAFNKNTNTKGAFIAGSLIVLALVAMITLLVIRKRPPKAKKFAFQFEQIQKKFGRR